MKKLLIGAAFCALFAAPAVAGDPGTVTPVNEPLRLSATQMDGVTAGDFCAFCANVNSTWQSNVGVAAAFGGGFFSDTEAEVEQENENETEQSIN